MVVAAVARWTLGGGCGGAWWSSGSDTVLVAVGDGGGSGGDLCGRASMCMRACARAGVRKSTCVC